MTNFKITSVHFDSEHFSVILDTGLELSVPYWWYPRLYNASPEERRNYEFIGENIGISWEKIDEDIHLEGLMQGKPDLSYNGVEWRVKNGFPSLKAFFPRGRYEIHFYNKREQDSPSRIREGLNSFESVWADLEEEDHQRGDSNYWYEILQSKFDADKDDWVFHTIQPITKR